MRQGRSAVRGRTVQVRRGMLALVAAALIVLAGPAGIAAAQCLAGTAAPAGHGGHAATTDVVVDGHGGPAHAEHGRTMAGHGDTALHDGCLPALDCCDLHCLAPGSPVPAAMPLTTPAPAAPLTPVVQLRAPPGAAGDDSPVLPVPPWTHPTLEQLTVLRV
ncbi:hypothetical protein [Tomitella gaofuii]|uniref:hypothetical protein n=1 Tax=Tomitella gaofuii TaxID=2760083 RepID=UPI0015F86ED8|nr:hypothetical protein [Tomitella gaofuii]